MNVFSRIVLLSIYFFIGNQLFRCQIFHKMAYKSKWPCSTQVWHDKYEMRMMRRIQAPNVRVYQSRQKHPPCEVAGQDTGYRNPQKSKDGQYLRHPDELPVLPTA